MSDFDIEMRSAALAADRAVAQTMKKYARQEIVDEPEITGVLIGRLDAAFNALQTGQIVWSSSIVRNGRGSAAEEKRVGADLLIHVAVRTRSQNFSKGVLIQAKRAEPNESVSSLSRLNKQCVTMLQHTASAFVFVYAKQSMRAGSASRFAGTTDPYLYNQACWRSYRFFLELFRCPIGDPSIISNRVDDLPIPKLIRLKGNY